MSALEVFSKAITIAKASSPHLHGKFRVAETADALGGKTLLWEPWAVHVSRPLGRSITFCLFRLTRTPAMRLPAFAKQ